jgi:hypothetical protein
MVTAASMLPQKSKSSKKAGKMIVFGLFTEKSLAYCAVGA